MAVVHRRPDGNLEHGKLDSASIISKETLKQISDLLDMKSGGERVRDEHWFQGWKYDDYYEDMVEIIDKRCLLIFFKTKWWNWVNKKCLFVPVHE